ncbi:hypothetical protein AAHA92_20632 [Salvia divinorum]|uniref:DDE Tnp4 domain-containing protein n=1 Tax=Salvia divinorum TaxID=28513 RepID=A0ABD1GHT2_SALDI
MEYADGLSSEALAVIIFDIIVYINCALRVAYMHMRIRAQVRRLTRLVGLIDKACIDNLQMDMNCFGRLCVILRERGGLDDDDQCQDWRWKWFPDFLGALDGTYINVLVESEDKPQYRTRKGDTRVLRAAVTRPRGIKVPKGQYYLCDNG